VVEGSALDPVHRTDGYHPCRYARIRYALTIGAVHTLRVAQAREPRAYVPRTMHVSYTCVHQNSLPPWGEARNLPTEGEDRKDRVGMAGQRGTGSR